MNEVSENSLERETSCIRSYFGGEIDEHRVISSATATIGDGKVGRNDDDGEVAVLDKEEGINGVSNIGGVETIIGKKRSLESSKSDERLNNVDPVCTQYALDEVSGKCIRNGGIQTHNKPRCNYASNPPCTKYAVNKVSGKCRRHGGIDVRIKPKQEQI